MSEKTRVEVNDESFHDNVIERSKTVPVVADFWAPWCMPCSIIGPVLDKLASEYGGKFLLAKINVDSSRESASRYRIMGIPAVKLFRHGKVVDEFVGALPESAIREWLKKHVK